MQFFIHCYFFCQEYKFTYFLPYLLTYLLTYLLGRCSYFGAELTLVAENFLQKSP